MDDLVFSSGATISAGDEEGLLNTESEINIQSTFLEIFEAMTSVLELGDSKSFFLSSTEGESEIFRVDGTSRWIMNGSTGPRIGIMADGDIVFKGRKIRLLQEYAATI